MSTNSGRRKLTVGSEDCHRPEDVKESGKVLSYTLIFHRLCNPQQLGLNGANCKVELSLKISSIILRAPRSRNPDVSFLDVVALCITICFKCFLQLFCCFFSHHISLVWWMSLNIVITVTMFPCSECEQNIQGEIDPKCESELTQSCQMHFQPLQRVIFSFRLLLLRLKIDF